MQTQGSATYNKTSTRVCVPTNYGTSLTRAHGPCAGIAHLHLVPYCMQACQVHHWELKLVPRCFRPMESDFRG